MFCPHDHFAILRVFERIQELPAEIDRPEATKLAMEMYSAEDHDVLEMIPPLSGRVLRKQEASNS